MTAETNQTSDAGRKVPTRRISFEESLQFVPKHFAAEEDLFASHLMASLSAVFPDGEDFFVRSVRNYRDRITDPDLKRQVTGFNGQALLERDPAGRHDPLGIAGLGGSALGARCCHRGLSGKRG